MAGEFDERYWEDRYQEHGAVWSGRPNPQLVAEVSDLPAGTALDAGCGEGADAVWLAARGWRVTAVDLAATALERARAHAGTVDPDAAGRVDWVRADLATWSPGATRYDLVCSHYVHPTGSRDALFRRLGDWVAPGGTLLIVGHHPSDLDTGVGRPHGHGVLFTPEQAAAVLDGDRWEIVTTEARARPATAPHDHQVTVHDSVLRARRRP